jgi:acyl transferase domain-containing protein/SAM-dependent methyltransferase/NAD(P)-dependent dehydrogenase (short-subunit alcohol dehydrogenase family)/acyl carrier protein
MMKTKANSVKEPIAIVGIGCRFPGGIKDTETFWHVLINGIDTMTEVPPDRFDINAYYDPEPQTPGKIVTRFGGFIEDVDKFDAEFFGIAPREAINVDPQQRLLAEVAWEALEDAGINCKELAGRKVSVYAGIFSNDYEISMFERIPDINFYSATGGAHYSAAGRLSYLFDLRGPSLAVETACSSSLVAVHLACQSLRLGESEIAVVGGVNLILTPHISIAFSNGRVLSPEGRCKFGDASANGFARGEGCGVLILKALSRAIEDNDRVYATILGSAINNDGRDGLLVAPSINGQIRVLCEAYQNAGIHPSQVSLIEAHGTGTVVGDPIEMKALEEVIGVHRTPQNPCPVGSVKTNIGHAETASGVAGLIKAALCLLHHKIPPSLHFEIPNPEIPWDKLNLKIVTELSDLPKSDQPAVVGINSFGLTGMNAHVVLEEFRGENAVDGRLRNDKVEFKRAFLLPLSAKTHQSLADTVRKWQQYLLKEDNKENGSLYDICYTASLRRTHHEYRLAVAGNTKAELSEKLSDLLITADSGRTNMVGGESQEAGGLVFVFSGQGPQWFGMGRMLLEQETVFRTTVERISELLEAHTGWSLLDEMKADVASSRMDQTEVAQPALFSLQMALAKLWESWGIRPDAVVGHSIGEVAAASYSGVLSLEDAVRVVYHRGRLLQKATGKGHMAAVEISPQEAEAVITKYSGRLSIAAFNSPSSVTLSGETEALEEVLESLQSRNLFCRMLAVNYAFHSNQVESYRGEMAQSVEGISTRPAVIPIVSTVTGIWAATGDFGPAYWAENIRRSVQFATAIDAVIQKGHRTFLELSPHPVLGGSISQCLASKDLEGTPLCSLRRNRDEIQTMLEALGALYAQGWHVNWENLYPNKGRCISLPTYCWQKKRYWITESKKPHAKELAHPNERGNEGQFLTGRRLLSPALKDDAFEFILNVDSMPFLTDHLVYGEVVVPAPVLMEIALSAARAAFGDEFRVLEDFRLHRALVLNGEDNKTIQMILKHEGREDASFEVFNRLAEAGSDIFSWEKLATGKIQTLRFDSTSESASLLSTRHTETQARCREQIPVDEFYRRFDEKGVKLGPLFQAFESISRSGEEAFARIRLPEPLEIEAQNYQIHPVLLDACLQLLTATWPKAETTATDNGLYLFFGLERFQQHAYAKPSPVCYATVQSRPQPEQETYFGDAQLFNEEGACVAEAKGICLKRARREVLIPDRSRGIGALIFKLIWRPNDEVDRIRERLAPPNLPGPERIAEQLQRSDIRVQSDEERHILDSLLPQLDQLCTTAILRAFNQLGWRMTIGDLMDVEDLVKKLGVAGQHRRLLARMVEMLQEDGILERRGSRWGVIRVPKIGDLGNMLSLVSGRYPEYEVELKILGRCLEDLPGVLLGEVDPVNLLFPNGSVSTAEKLYQDAPLSRRINALVRKTISMIAEQVPEGRVIKILEIGGGTGGTTAHVLPELPPNRTEYVFTDISNFFLDKARGKFHDYSFVFYRILDIEKHPEEQGIAPHEFDLVLASNVLHATADLHQTLQHISQILAPDGLLLLVEGVRPARWIDMTFGLTTGWWRFADVNLRAAHPLLARRKWADLLSDEHFREATVVPPSDGELGGVFDQAVILARGPVSREVEDPNKKEVSLDERFLNENGEERGSWLIFSDRSGIGANLAETLQTRRDTCILVYPGQSYEILTDTERRINPMQAEDYKLLLRDVVGSEKLPCRAAIFLWGADAESTAVMWDDLERIAVSACSSLVNLINSLLALEEVHLPRIWIATSGAQSLSEKESPQLGQAPLWGMGRVLAVEHPELWGGLIDLDPNGTPNEAALNLLNHISRGDNENQLLVRGNSSYVPCLVPWQKLSEKSLRWVPEGNYLITGGLGDLGLQTARWMVEQGARRLILLGRTPLPERSDWDRLRASSPHFRRISAIRRLEALGAFVKTESVDVGDEGQLRSFLERLRTDGWTPIRGAIHTAAVAKDALLSRLDAAGFQQVWRPKATGALLLHQLLEGEPLDFFILFSSLGSLLGQTGQGNYAAANAFLDALASHRRARGQPALSVNWGSWIGSGLAITPGGKRTIQNLSLCGIEGISPQKATEAMGVLMQERATQATVMGVNRQRFRSMCRPDRGYLALSQWSRAWVRNASGPISGGGEKNQYLIQEHLMAVERGPKRRRILEKHLAETLAGVLKTDLSAIHRDRPFGEMGLDSLMALEVKSRCESSLGLKLSASMAWNYPTLHLLTTHLSEKLGIPLDEADQNDTGGTNVERLATDELRAISDTGVLGRVDELSDEEALQALLGKAKS